RALQLHADLERLRAAAPARPVGAADHPLVRLVAVLLHGDRVRAVDGHVLARERRGPDRDAVDDHLGPGRRGGDLEQRGRRRRRGGLGRLFALGGLGGLGRFVTLGGLGGLGRLGAV